MAQCAMLESFPLCRDYGNLPTPTPLLPQDSNIPIFSSLPELARWVQWSGQRRNSNVLRDKQKDSNL